MKTVWVNTGGNGNMRPTPTPYLYLFRPEAKPEKVILGSSATPQDNPSPKTVDAVVCRQCHYVVTSIAERIIIDGAHAHVFANPEGIVFEIVCYRKAWGCGYIGPRSPEFTWFAGYEWRIAVCANCHIHLGWRFSGIEGSFFHGLITSRLAVKEA